MWKTQSETQAGFTLHVRNKFLKEWD